MAAETQIAVGSSVSLYPSQWLVIEDHARRLGLRGKQTRSRALQDILDDWAQMRGIDVPSQATPPPAPTDPRLAAQHQYDDTPATRAWVQPTLETASAEDDEAEGWYVLRDAKTGMPLSEPERYRASVIATINERLAANGMKRRWWPIADGAQAQSVPPQSAAALRGDDELAALVAAFDAAEGGAE